MIFTIVCLSIAYLAGGFATISFAGHQSAPHELAKDELKFRANDFVAWDKADFWEGLWSVIACLAFLWPAMVALAGPVFFLKYLGVGAFRVIDGLYTNSSERHKVVLKRQKEMAGLESVSTVKETA